MKINDIEIRHIENHPKFGETYEPRQDVKCPVCGQVRLRAFDTYQVIPRLLITDAIALGEDNYLLFCYHHDKTFDCKELYMTFPVLYDKEL